jgi:PiT family inorganic phosphate transporter
VGPILASFGAEIGADDLAGQPSLQQSSAPQSLAADAAVDPRSGPQATRSAVRNEVYRLVTELKVVTQNANASPADKAEATRLRGELRPAVEYAPWWVRVPARPV